MKCKEYGMVERLRKFADIIEGTEILNRPLTQEEYKYIKEFPLYGDVQEFWNNHLSPNGYLEYQRASSQGRYGKWRIYQDLYKKYNNKLARALK